MEKKKLDDFSKFKLVYCIEIGVFAIIFAVLGILFLTKVIAIRDWKYWVFPILTLLGGIWLIIDIIWLLKSPFRQKKNSILDKILPLPAAVPVIGFDIYFLINNANCIGLDWYESLFRTLIGIVLCYYSAIYLFQSIFHWFKPAKQITFAYEDAMRQVAEAEAKERAEAEAKEKEEKQTEDKKESSES